MTKTLRIGTTALLACAGLALARPAECQLRGAPEGFVGVSPSLFGTAARQPGFHPTQPRTLQSWAGQQTLRFAVAQLSHRALTPTPQPALAVERMTALQSTLAVDLRPEPIPAAMVEPVRSGDSSPSRRRGAASSAATGSSTLNLGRNRAASTFTSEVSRMPNYGQAPEDRARRDAADVPRESAPD